MVNQNVQGPIPLGGKGYVYRPHGYYEQGEYFKCVNAELTSRGTLVPRPSAQAYYVVGGDIPGHDLRPRILGSYKANPLISSHTIDLPYESYQSVDALSITETTTSAQQATFQTTLLAIRPTVASDGGFTDAKTQLLGFFTYNNKFYYIAFVRYRINNAVAPYGTNDLLAYVVVAEATLTNPNSTLSLNNFTATASGIVGRTSATLSGLYSLTSFYSGVNAPTDYYNNNTVYPMPLVRDWLLYRDRLWVIIDDTVYFTAATNPTNFVIAGGSGGFIKFPGQGGSVKGLAAVGDFLYVLLDRSIHVVTYETAFDTDGAVTQISDTVGGEDITVHGDTAYVVNTDAVYTVNGNNVSRLMDLELDLDTQYTKWCDHDGTNFTQGSLFDFKLQAFEEALFIVPRYVKPRPGVKTHWETYYSSSNIGDSCVRVDLNSGFVSVYDFGLNGKAVDLMITSEDHIDQRVLNVLCEVSATQSNLLKVGSNPRYPYGWGGSATWSPQNAYNLDIYVPAAVPNTIRSAIPSMDVYLKRFSPDDMHYLIKKIRSLQVDMNVPRRWDGAAAVADLMTLKVYCGGGASVEPTLVLDKLIASLDPNAVEGMYPEVLRYGINQRSRWIDVRLTMTEYDYAAWKINDDSYLTHPMWEIRDLRTLWSYTDRGPTNKPE